MTNFYLVNILTLLKREYFFRGWGRKKTGRLAQWCYRTFGGNLTLYEDGFIRSIGLGVIGWESFSRVEDEFGIYYDATTPSYLEHLLNTHQCTQEELEVAKKAIKYIQKHKISKYNDGLLSLPMYLKNDTKKILIIAQTQGDMSLHYGLANQFDTKQMILDAKKAHPQSELYLKIHPDVLYGKKESNIDVSFAKQHCKIIVENINPLVLLEQFYAVYTQTSQMGFEALLLGLEVYLYGMPFYGGWGITNDKLTCRRRKRVLSVEEIFVSTYMLYSKYYNPYLQKKSTLLETLETVVRFRDIYAQNDGNLYFFGFSLWKQKHIKHFFKPLHSNSIHFCTTLEDALAKGLDAEAKVYIWGKKEFENLVSFCQIDGMQVYRVEDGFIRSVTLGSDLTKAYSLVVDSRGIYFDPRQENDLEYILQTYEFDSNLLARAKKIQKYLVEKKLSKYNIYEDKQLTFNTEKKIILVVGQVEDDASIIYGGYGMSNLELLQKVYERVDGYIIYKPHPDVLAGNRKGNIEKKIVLSYAHEMLAEVSLPSLLEVCDELHTITSLSGFEALLRGKKVYTYGKPFYAGWGLTIDEKVMPQRVRKLTLSELIAATYILYPRYMNPENSQFCEVEVVIEKIEQLKVKYNNDKIYRFLINLRNLISRKAQLVMGFFSKVLKSE